MNSRLLSFLMILIVGLFVCTAEAQVIKTVGATGADFTSLRQAMAAVNANTGGEFIGAIELQIVDNTIEPSDGVVSSGLVSIPVSTVWTSLKIYPTVKGKTISGDFSGALISLEGANNVTIDGRVNQIGSTRALTIINTGGSNQAVASTISFRMDATNNTVKYCTIKGACTNLYGGIITFGSTTALGGNNNNTISNNLITNVSNNLRPTYCIYSAGSLSNGAPNKSNIISNNDFADFLTPATDLTQLNMAIRLDKMNDSWTITGNSFYETTSFEAIEDASYEVIHIQSGGGHTISGNYIGGSSTKCGGAPLTKSQGNNEFSGIVITANASPVSNVQNNIIKNINWTNTGLAEFHMINSQGGVNINSNIIGDFIIPGSITLTGGSGSGSVKFYGIQCINTGTATISNNKIGSIVANSSDPAGSVTFCGIFNQSTGITTVSGNIIGNSAAENNISVGGLTANNFIYGIRSLGTGTSVYSGNIISNLTNIGKANVYGFYVQNGTNTLTGNYINRLSFANSNTSSNAIYGINFIGSIGTSLIANNLITLGGTSTNTIYGISIENKTPASNTNLYFNTVCVGGNETSQTGKSYSLSSIDPLNLNRDFRNNIFSNTRYTVGATGLHYGVYLNYGAGTLNCNYNDYFVSGSASVLGNYSAMDLSTLPIVTEQIGNDVNSLAINPGFANAAGATDIDYKTSTTLSGVSGTGILVDYLGIARGATPRMGAFEVLYSGLTDHPIDFPYHLFHTTTGVRATFEGDATVELYTINGQLIDKIKASNSYSYNLDNGVFIIRINGKACKFIK